MSAPTLDVAAVAAILREAARVLDEHIDVPEAMKLAAEASDMMLAWTMADRESGREVARARAR